MNLAAIVNEVLAKGFDSNVWRARIVQYANDALMTIASECDYYQDEAVQQFATVAGTDTYAWPAGLAEIRSLFDTDRRIELQYASLREMDRSGALSGAPTWYAVSGQNVRLFPVPDLVYNLELRYWQLPATLAADGDVPSLPVQWHKLIWLYATFQCFESDDDREAGQYWEGRWNREFSAFKADVKFSTTDGPRQLSSMWDNDPSLSPQAGWSLGTGD